jgi:hypothetical protein
VVLIMLFRRDVGGDENVLRLENEDEVVVVAVFKFVFEVSKIFSNEIAPLRIKGDCCCCCCCDV